VSDKLVVEHETVGFPLRVQQLFIMLLTPAIAIALGVSNFYYYWRINELKDQLVTHKPITESERAVQTVEHILARQNFQTLGMDQSERLVDAIEAASYREELFRFKKFKVVDKEAIMLTPDEFEKLSYRDDPIKEIKKLLLEQKKNVMNSVEGELTRHLKAENELIQAKKRMIEKDKKRREEREKLRKMNKAEREKKIAYNQQLSK
jgi:hypothetical protein